VLLFEGVDVLEIMFNNNECKEIRKEITRPQGLKDRLMGTIVSNTSGIVYHMHNIWL